MLGIDRVGIDDDFFDLGGHSLLAVKMLARLQDTLGVTVPLGRLFDSSTLRELSEVVIIQLMGDASGDELAQMVADAEAAER